MSVQGHLQLPHLLHLSYLSQVFKRILCKQIDSFMENKFSPLRGFRKNRNAQYSLLNMIENWSKQLDNGEKVGVIFMDLLKAFDTTNCSLLLAKLKTYGFPDQVYYKVADVTDFREA